MILSLLVLVYDLIADLKEGGCGRLLQDVRRLRGLPGPLTFECRLCVDIYVALISPYVGARLVGQGCFYHTLSCPGPR